MISRDRGPQPGYLIPTVDFEKIEASLEDARRRGAELVEAGNLDGHNLASLAEIALNVLRTHEDGSLASAVMMVTDYRHRIEGYQRVIDGINRASKGTKKNQQEAGARKSKILAVAAAIRAEAGKERWLKNAVAQEIVDRGSCEGLSHDRIRKLLGNGS